MKVLLVGPVPRVVTGQSKAFMAVVRGLPSGRLLDFGTGLRSLSFFFRALVEFVLYRPDVVYFTTSRTLLGFARDLWIVLLAGFFGRGRLVNHLHGADFLSFRERMPTPLQWLIDKIYSRINCSIVLAHEMKEQYSRYADMDVRVVPNFFEPAEVYSGVGAKRKEIGRCLNVLYLSNIMCSKGILDLIQACELYFAAGRSVRLKIAGFPIGDHLMSGGQIDREVNSRLNDFISREGVVSGRQKAELLDWAHVLCLPTYYPTEAQPISLIEGLAAGCYLVSTRQGFIESIYDEQAGSFVDAMSPESICSALIEVANLGAGFGEISIKNSVLARDKFSLESYIESIKKCIVQEVL
ncbi:glycosyltransferase family 4 protein [Pseudomonas sp. NPDC077186]|uniref:glycosyltransferase family 4 protein n=1 Tax=Pseudomonas sp. NPDC077186 TaxID=3364421 RepID=UPI0037C730A4